LRPRRTRPSKLLGKRNGARIFIQAALARVRQRVNPKALPVFDGCVLQGLSAGEVARMLGLMWRRFIWHGTASPGGETRRGGRRSRTGPRARLKDSSAAGELRTNAAHENPSAERHGFQRRSQAMRAALGGNCAPLGAPRPRLPAADSRSHAARRIGRGAYGEVWLARSALGTLRAVKVVYRARFEDDHPYEREFKGIVNTNRSRALTKVTCRFCTLGA